MGNPGRTYHGTRHNVGFQVVQALAERHRVAWQERLVNPTGGRPAGVAATCRMGDQTVQLLMPLTMMNESGEAIEATGMAAQELLVVCDDVNLLLGTIRLRAEGGSGGHHGLQSCLEALGTERVARLRIGVGVAALPPDLRDFVLSPFERTERPIAMRAIEQAADACEVWAREGIENAMNQYNRALET